MIALDGPRREPASGGPARHLVVLCHGIGATGNDIIPLAGGWSAAVPTAEFVAPTGPVKSDPHPKAAGRMWFDPGDRSPEAMRKGVRQAADVLDEFIDAELARLKLRIDRVALMGFSQGAMTAMYTGLRRPYPPRAILSYAGAMLDPMMPHLARGGLISVLMVHGKADPTVPVARSYEAEQLLLEAGIAVQTLYQPNHKHNIDEESMNLGGLFLHRLFALG